MRSMRFFLFVPARKSLGNSSTYVKDSLTPENVVPALKVRHLLRFCAQMSQLWA